MDNGRASRNPLQRATWVHDGTDVRHDHCPLTVEQFRQVWEYCNSPRTPEQYGATGRERALIYLLAAETGLRANEIRSLKVSSFDFNLNLVSVDRGTTKNRKGAVLPLRPKTAVLLQDYFAGKLPESRAFYVTDKTSDMVRDDLEAIGVPYQADDSSYRDFHGLRHLTGTLLNDSDINLPVAQRLLRHSDPKLTANVYTHIYHEQLSQAVGKLPDLTAPPAVKRERIIKTGTAGPELPAKSPANFCDKGRISANVNEQKSFIPDKETRFYGNEKGSVLPTEPKVTGSNPVGRVQHDENPAYA